MSEQYKIPRQKKSLNICLLIMPAVGTEDACGTPFCSLILTIVVWRPLWTPSRETLQHLLRLSILIARVTARFAGLTDLTVAPQRPPCHNTWLIRFISFPFPRPTPLSLPPTTVLSTAPCCYFQNKSLSKLYIFKIWQCCIDIRYDPWNSESMNSKITASCTITVLVSLSTNANKVQYVM